jgi:D-ribose pyranase
MAMKKHGILNHELIEVIATLGHTDALVIADAGLPIPPEVKRIDLAVVGGVPKFMDVLRAVLDEMQVEHATVASEMALKSPQLRGDMMNALGNIPVAEVSHAEFKQLTCGARAIVRTGEFTPYANIILYSGVVF